jgi:glycosyltransferase involved in cell wall biosynthesis
VSSTILEPVTRSTARARSRRLLVISYHFPPDGAVGGLRWAGLSKYLARVGWEVHIVTAAKGPASVAPGVHRHHCRPRRTLKDRFGVLAGMALFTDNGRGWILRAAATARRLMREHQFDAVVTSGPPHSAHLAGFMATPGKAIPHVIDMRNPWRMTSSDRAGSAFRQRRFGPLERLMFLTTHNVVVNTRELADSLQAQWPGLTVSLVTNGTDTETLPARTEELFDGVSIAYAGIAYEGRGFMTLLSALESLRRDRPIEATRVKLRIAGPMDAARLGQFDEELRRRGLEKMVELYGALTRADTLDLLRRSHLALVLAQDQATQIPARLYESVGLAVPTLVISESTNAASREALRLGGIVLEPDDSVGMRCLLDDLVDGLVPTMMPPTAPISYESLALQMDQLLRDAMAPVS